MESLSRFAYFLPERITVHLDAGCTSEKTCGLLGELGGDYVISARCGPLQAGTRWVVERTKAWHNRSFRNLSICTERAARVIEVLNSIANIIIVLCQLIKEVRGESKLGFEASTKA
ncbi:MAG TPA: hypothetical protein DEB66_02355 [Micrococcaceae bacterium]|nr:hypothetical protein [Micrococcaceae bacterium]